MHEMYFFCSRVLESVFVLLSSPVTSSHLSIFAAVRDLLAQLLDRRSGLLYLCSKHDQTNGIVRALVQVRFGVDLLPWANGDFLGVPDECCSLNAMYEFLHLVCRSTRARRVRRRRARRSSSSASSSSTIYTVCSSLTS